MSFVAPLPPESVRPGGKEELRASVLKTYLLRIRAEKGDEAVQTLLRQVGIDASIVDKETGWVSASAAKRALRAIEQLLGPEALMKRGEWVTHPEALGTMVGMLRVAERPVDAYRYLASHEKEVTRIGTWEFDESDNPPPGSAKEVTSARLTYLIREDVVETLGRAERAAERLLCAARIGELASIPRIWGLPEAHVSHDTCISRGQTACIYSVQWRSVQSRVSFILGGLGSSVVSGGAVATVGGWLAGVVAAVFGGILGGGAAYLWNLSKADQCLRALERNRIAALERGLELRGEVGTTPGELTGIVLGGKYRIARRLGSGGIGVVYAAEHTALGHEVAVKVLRGAAAIDGSEMARLRREAYIQVHIEHPNIVRVMDLDQMPDGSIYVVMERLTGRSLADKLGREGAIPPGVAVPVFIDVCKALAAAHRKGVVHRDLKPGNIFLCEDGNSKVLDFGMSKLTTAESLTQAGYTLGTPEYMAPEQCVGGAVEPRTDIYALGVVMYEALTGELPIRSKNRRELLDLHQRQIPSSMRAKRPELPLPEELDTVVMRCLRKRPQDRPRSASELEQMLQAIPMGKLPKVYPPGLGKRPKSQTASTETTDPAMSDESLKKDT